MDVDVKQELRVEGGHVEDVVEEGGERAHPDVDDEEDWATSDELADDDNDSNAVVAESALDR